MNTTNSQPENTHGESTADSPRHTAMGSPCSPAWDNAWIAVIDETETRENKRICGARTRSGRPCMLAPNHQNGRCRFHGGFDLTGAQPGNRNAVVHGLYSRAVQTCGAHCPMWRSCPCAGTDIEQTHPADRPKCPYETAQYNVALTDALSALDVPRTPNPLSRHLAHQVALLQVMISRAMAAMSEDNLIDMTVVTSEKRGMSTRKASAYFDVFMRLSSEYRRYLAMPLFSNRVNGPENVSLKEQNRRAKHDTDLTPEAAVKLEPPSFTPLTPIAQRLIDRAREQLGENRPKSAQTSIDLGQRFDHVLIRETLNPDSPYFEQYLAALNCPP